VPGIAVIGGQWGDEGKGKVIDLLSASADIVARYQGGPNAGHTVQIGESKFFLHHIPSGILHPTATCVIGNGVVLLPDSMIEEARLLREAGVSMEGRLFVSNRAHVILPDHLVRDASSEAGVEPIGTTRRGVGPCYEAKIGRRGIRVEDLRSADRLRGRLQATAGGVGPTDEVMDLLLGFGRFLSPFVADTVDLLNRRLDEGAKLLIEGAQGTLLDIDHGTYPFVTSSSSSAGGIAAGLGIGPTRIAGVIGVMKAYATRVGEGPMPTELQNADGDRIRERGREYGTTTGRPRRCGWFDAVLARYAVRVNALDAVALTLLDVLDDFESIRLCTGYRIEGRVQEGIPIESWMLAEAEPVYEELPGWMQDTRGSRRIDELPGPARDFIRRLEERIACPVGLVSVGPDRDEFLVPGGSRLTTWFPGLGR
jgi:adenylosuccinate synthase